MPVVHDEAPEVDDIADFEADEIDHGVELVDEEIEAMLNGIAQARVDPDAQDAATAEFIAFLDEIFEGAQSDGMSDF